MLKYRLIFGTLMTVLFTAIVILDGHIGGSLNSTAGSKPLQGTLVCILVAILIIPAQLELSKLAAAKNLKIFAPLSIIASILFATSWYWPQLVEIPIHIYLFFLSALTLLGLFLYQHARYGVSGVIANCGANYFSIIYLGLLSAFVPAIQIDFGAWFLLMFIFVVKSSDIGAYTIGTLFGKHKFSPRISPKKTWEGLVGAAAAAMIVAIIFAAVFDIMNWRRAAIFGFCFAFIGQFGDLAESMLKRDAEQKDASNNVPGFGGLLDVIDSPLAAAPFAYLFFMYCS